MEVMHDPAQVIAFVTFSAVVAGTPGPSNMLLTAVGARAGVRHGLPSLLGQVAGMSALLFAITLRKAHDLVRDQRRQKRGGSAPPGPPHPPEEANPEQLLGREPTPEFAAQVAEECQRLLGRLGDAELRSVALWKMEGYTNEEIAQKLGRSDRTVERKLRLIRQAWEEEAPP